MEYVCELKYDGTSISLRYEDGNLQVAVTRGDGVKGDDVTTNVRTIRTVPLHMQGGGLSRGVRDSGGFNAFCRVQSIERGAAGGGRGFICQPAESRQQGTLKLQNSSIVAKRQLDCYLYYVPGENHADPDTLREFNESEGMGV